MPTRILIMKTQQPAWFNSEPDRSVVLTRIERFLEEQLKIRPVK
jgi:hypothetical protein